MSVFDRRRLLAAEAILAAPGIMSSRAAQAIEASNALVTGRLTIDMHSHGGGFIREDTSSDPVVDAMRAGGMAVACLAIVSDAPTHKIFPDRTIYRAFPLLAQALLARGFSPEDAGKILGGNYARVFAATVG